MGWGGNSWAAGAALRVERGAVRGWARLHGKTLGPLTDRVRRFGALAAPGGAAAVRWVKRQEFFYRMTDHACAGGSEVEFTLYTIPLWIVVVVGSGLALLTAMNRDQRGAYPLLGVFVGAVIWAGAYAMQFSTGDPGAAVRWHEVRYFGSTIVPVAMLLLAFEFTGHRRWLTGPKVAGLFAVPMLTNVVIWTNNRYHTWWATFTYRTDPAAVPRLVAHWGPWYPVYTFYSLGVAFCAIGLFTGEVLLRDGPLVNTTSAFLAATVLPTLGTFVYVTGYSPIDFGPYAFVVSGLLIMAAMFVLDA